MIQNDIKNIVLLCAAGMSTSLLVNKLREAAVEKNYQCKINAYSLTEASNQIPEADIVMLGPQVRFNKEKLLKEFPDKIIEVIDMRDYGMMNGENVLESIISLLETI